LTPPNTNENLLGKITSFLKQKAVFLDYLTVSKKTAIGNGAPVRLD